MFGEATTQNGNNDFTEITLFTKKKIVVASFAVAKQEKRHETWCQWKQMRKQQDQTKKDFFFSNKIYMWDIFPFNYINLTCQMKIRIGK